MLRAFGILAICTVSGFWSTGQEKVKSAAGGGRLFSASGTLLTRAAAGKPWMLPEIYADIRPGEQLVALPGGRAIVEVKEGDVRLSLLGNLPELSPSPVLETVITLDDAKGFDAELTLDRGRLLIESRAQRGTVTIRCRFPGNMVELALEPRTTVALERFSVWPPGVPFLKKQLKEHEPVSEVIFLALKGTASVTFEGERHAVQAPVVYQWNARAGVRGPWPLKKTPLWLTPGEDKAPRTSALYAAVEKLRRKIAADKHVKTFADSANDKDELVRAVVVLSAGAVDEVDLVVDALGDARHAQARQAAAVGLRHWIARGPGNDQRLYELLTDKKYSPGEAEICLQLLHSFGERDLQRPETYEALINYLASPQVAIRELGYWHLMGLVPPGRDIAFDAGADADRLATVQAAWRKLIPPGELPKRP